MAGRRSLREFSKRMLFCGIVASLLAFSLVRAVAATHQCKWPSEWDLLRDISMAETILAGRYPEDPILQGETLWYNPLTGAILAVAQKVSGISLPRLGILLGPYLNLITPLGIVVLLSCLFGRAAALAGLCMVLYGKYPHNPFWVQVCYAPWLMAPLYASGLMFLTLAAVFRAYTRRSLAWHVVAGVLLGVAFMAHTAPAIIAGGTMVLLLLVEIAGLHRCCPTTVQDASKSGLIDKRDPVRRTALVFVLLGTAFLISLPFTYSILWNYGFQVRNPHPSLFTANFVLLQELPARVGESIQWRNGAALVGLIVLLRRRDRASWLVLCWLAVAGAMMAQHYLWQLLLLRFNIMLPGLAPGHHWAIHLSAVRAALFAVGVVSIGEGISIAATRWRHLRTRTKIAPGRSGAVPVAGFAAAALAGMLLYTAHPLTTRADFQIPDMTLYHQYHQVRMPMYEWIRTQTPPDAVILCFDDAVAMTVVMPAARKLLHPMMIYSNLYVDPGVLSYDRFRLVDAIQRQDLSAFCDERERYSELYMLITVQEHAEKRPEELMLFTEVHRAGGLVLLQALSCPSGAAVSLENKEKVETALPRDK